MGKPRLVRITNRGSFPRWRLESVGSTSKRGMMDDPTQGGWFGSGTKIAPIAALALNMDVAISSDDSEGSYLVSYDIVRRDRDGECDARVVRIYHGDQPHRQVTEFSPDAFMNWSKPIGDDDKKEFRVWREYFRNAQDADPEMRISESLAAVPTPKGTTSVFLSRTAEFDEIMSHVNRYFKYLSTDEPIFICGGVGQFWPKSQPGTTRMFSQGTMALCHDNLKSNWTTLFDYSFDNKELMSEERTFENMTKVYLELARMLCSIPDVTLALVMLKAIVEGRAELERVALGQVGSKWAIAGAEVWKAAWYALNGDNAVIASGNWFDQHARFAFGRNPVFVRHQSLKSFLKHCGVQDSADVVPAGDKMGYRVIVPEPRRVDVLAEAKTIVMARYPGVAMPIVLAYRPLTEETRKGMRGFCMPPEPPFTTIYILETELDDLHSAVGTLNHEMRHVVTGAKDGTPELMDRADDDAADMLIELRRCDAEHAELIFDEEPTDPGGYKPDGT